MRMARMRGARTEWKRVLNWEETESGRMMREVVRAMREWNITGMTMEVPS
jgi:hypothetical protein